MNLRLRWIKEEWSCSLWHSEVLSSLLSWRRSRPVQAVPGLNVGRDYRCRDWDFTWVSSVHPEKWRDSTSFSVRPLPSHSLPLHHCYHQPCRLSCRQWSAAKHMKDTAHCWHFGGHTWPSIYMVKLWSWRWRQHVHPDLPDYAVSHPKRQ